MPANPILEQMLDRLYASLIRGPGLNCRPHSSRQRIDLTALAAFDDLPPDRLIPQLLGDDEACAIAAKAPPPQHNGSAVRFDSEHDAVIDLPPHELSARAKAEEDWQRQRSVLTKLRNLSEDARTYEQETGVAVLHVGYPILSLPPNTTAGSNKRVLAPMAFVPVSLNVHAGHKAGVELRCAGKGVDRVVPNAALMAWVERETGQPIEDLFEDEEGEQPFQEIADLVAQIAGRMELGDIDAGSFVQADTFALDKVPLAEDLPDRPAVLRCGVLGMFPASNQGLLRDTKDMIAEPQLDGPVRSFIDVEATLDAREQTLEEAEHVVEANRRRFADERFVALADPFQSRAVTLARTSRGLVVHGPPGTGKSQTITNIIGDHLARGQRVLFVCDKRTALDVVANRLEHLGLGGLCAVVHDPKRDQRDLYMKIRAQLEELESLGIKPRSEKILERIDGDLQKLHNELSDLYAALMTETEDAPSLHELMGAWLSIETAIDAQLLGEAVGKLSPDRVDAHREDVEVILTRAGSVDYEHNPWRRCLGATLEAFLTRPVDGMRRALGVCVEDARSLDTTADERIPPFGADAPLDEQATLREDLAARLTWLTAECDEAIRQRVSKWDVPRVVQTTGQLEQLRPFQKTVVDGALDVELSLGTRDMPMAASTLNQDIADLQAYLDAAQKWYGFLAFGAKKRAGEVVRKFGLRRNPAEAERLCQHLTGVRARLVLSEGLRQLDEQEPSGKPIDDAPLLGLYEQYSRAAEARQLADGDPTLAELFAAALADAAKAADFVEGLQRSPRRAEALAALESSMKDAELFAVDWLGQAAAHFRSGHHAADTVVKLESTFDEAESVARVRDGLMQLPDELRGAVAKLAEHSATPDEGLDAITKAVLQVAIGRRIAADRNAQRIDDQRLENMFNRYGELENQKREKVRDAILLYWGSLQRGRLLATTGTRLNSLGAALRRRLFVRGKRAMRLRQVIKSGEAIEGGDPLFDICPVWMASPETVAQVFPRREMFDVVIFDEASQCRLEEALPVLTRAKRVVVAGDPKQLPPTRFFEAAITTSEADELETDQDLFEAQQAEVEDLLAAALNLQIDEAFLDVHYRSRNADLIEFSNEMFYRSRLQAIPGHPSHRTPYPPLTLYRADGVYDERCNHVEAQRVVQIVDDLLRRAEPPSVGIACFNLKQREIILDELENRALDDDGFASRLARARKRRGEGSFEGLFVKNLENVQGDERDHIVISTTYGPNKEGKFYRRFGPLGRAGGGRRLNVLVTRARHEVHLVTSIPREAYMSVEAVPEGMTPNGGWLLFAYLRYAEELASLYERDQRVLEDEQNRRAPHVMQRPIEPFSHFAMALGVRLADERHLGSDVHWGNTGFCVDLALHHPGKLEDATIGVLCDFARFADCPDPIEWEVYRTNILRWTGWDLHRVWTPTYFRDPQRVLNGVERQAQAHIEAQAGETEPGA